MVFSSPYFLFLFCPLALGAYYGARWVRGQHAALLAVFVVSVFFYYWSAARDTAYLIALIVGNYAVALGMGRPKGRWLFALAVLLDLCVLGWFKYAHFLAENADTLLGTAFAVGLGEIALPAGVSFFVFQAISYLVDVRRGELAADRSLVRYGAYQAFFPHLIAGPIVRYRDIVDDLRSPGLDASVLGSGVARFAHGLAKKVLIADGVAPLADAAFGVEPSSLTPSTAWLGALAYTLQIYFDFSGYSDMAIGLARMFGIRFHENFERPYSSTSVTEFWRRWHISLSSWFRDYVYIPLGGSRGGALHTYRNLLIVFALTGMWHGAAWSFLAWGMFHGAFLVAERLLTREPIKRLRHPVLRIAYCLPVVMFGWVLFRAPSLDFAVRTWAAMARVVFGAGGLDPSVASQLAPHAVLALCVGGLVLLAPRNAPSFGSQLIAPASGSRIRSALELGYTFVALVACGVLMLTGNFSPFLYFSF
jgi:alginate O-acetyltransferase complex protein AlgI